MSTFGKILLLILLNVIVSASVTYGVLYYWDNIRNADKPLQLVTVSEQQAENDAAGDVQPTAELLPETALPEAEDVPEEVPTQEPTPVIRGSNVEISIIRSVGVLSTEALRIVSNSDDVVSLKDWTLEDANGHVLKLQNIQLLRKGIYVDVYSRAGHDTPYEIYWGLAEAVWQSGETAVLKDVFGQIQATYRVP